MDFRRHYDRQERILQSVRLEDVGEAGADDGAESELREGPRGVLARATAAEIVAGQQDLGSLGAGLVEDEIGLGIALIVVAPIAEELLVQALLRGGLQESRWDDLVGIYIVVGQRD